MKVLKDISIQKLNTFGIDVKCKLFCKIENENDFLKLIISDEFKNNRTLILGGGSNLLFTKNFDGLIIKNEIRGKEIIEDSKNTKTIKVGAGENWHEFVLWSIKEGLSGIENMALIPGNVGASPMQNIGAYGAEAKNVIENVFAINKKNGESIVLNNSECNFKYRDSIFKHDLKDKVFITHVSFILNKTPNNNTTYGDIEKEIESLNLDISTESICKAVIKIRERKLPNPSEIGNSGSFFKNPIISSSKFLNLQRKFPNIIGYKISSKTTKVAAGWLIEKCGWKGYREGDAGVHTKQALVLVNYGNANGKQIQSLAQKVQLSVKKKFDIQLSPEVNMI